MSYAIHYVEPTREEVADIHEELERRRPGAGERFFDALDEVEVRLSALPELYALVFRDGRIAPIGSTGYILVYRFTGVRVEVVCVQHASQDDFRWQRRL